MPYYTGEIQGFGLFNLEGVPKKTYYAFKAFRAMLDTPQRLELPALPGSRLAGLAGVDAAHTRVAMLFSNPGDSSARFDVVLTRFPAGVHPECEVLVLDTGHDLTAVRREALATETPRLSVDLTAQSVVLIRIGFAGKAG